MNRVRTTSHHQGIIVHRPYYLCINVIFVVLIAIWLYLTLLSANFQPDFKWGPTGSAIESIVTILAGIIVYFVSVPTVHEVF